MVFTSIHTMVSHKRHYCKLRFTCKCESEVKSLKNFNPSFDNNGDCLQVCPDQAAPPPYLQCSNCSLGFPDPWDLMEHVQVNISINIIILIFWLPLPLGSDGACSSSLTSSLPTWSSSGSAHNEHLSTVWTPRARWQWQHHFRFLSTFEQLRCLCWR